jgi:hypothetical protein
MGSLELCRPSMTRMCAAACQPTLTPPLSSPAGNDDDGLCDNSVCIVPLSYGLPAAPFNVSDMALMASPCAPHCGAFNCGAYGDYFGVCC